jgi:outer membrane protein OmpA-like peptidoglycan-associated protein
MCRVFAPRHRPRPLVPVLAGMLAALTFAPDARASGPDAQRLRLMPGLDEHGLTTPSARPAFDRPFSVGLVFDHADDPVVVRGGGLPDDAVVDSQSTLRLLLSGYVLPRWHVGLEAPFIVHQGGRAPDSFDAVDSGGASGVATGDLRLLTGVTLFTTETREAPRGVSLGLQGELYLPTGDEAQYQGEGWRGEARLVGDLAVTNTLSFGAAAGYRLRERDRLANLQANDEVTYAAAAHIGLGQRFELVPEANGAVGVLGDSPDTEEAPLEALLGLRFFASPHFTLHAAGGVGVVGGFGIPAWRGLFGVTWRVGDTADARHRFAAAAAPVDRCPEAPEDLDGFEDDDGCPDLDDDRDGVPDANDDCRLGPEDRDGFEDDDGCADPDDDRDGFLDAADACPREPEDHDGVDDADGCPEPDDDQDTVADRADVCPAAGEVVNGYRDADGCPDEKPLEIDCKGFEFGGDVLFESGQATLLARSLPLLDRIARRMIEMPELRRIRLEGHTDAQGAADLNLDLSQRRVDEVRRRLVESGVAADRIEALGRGETQPVATNATPEGRARNRRVVFVVVDREGCVPAGR